MLTCTMAPYLFQILHTHHQGQARSENTVTDICLEAAFEAVDMATDNLVVVNRMKVRGERISFLVVALAHLYV
jgi:hypothetical protein